MGGLGIRCRCPLRFSRYSWLFQVLCPSGTYLWFPPCVVFSGLLLSLPILHLPLGSIWSFLVAHILAQALRTRVLPLLPCSSTEWFCPSLGGIGIICRHFLLPQLVEQGSVLASSGQRPRMLFKHSIMHRITPATKKYLAQNDILRRLKISF